MMLARGASVVQLSRALGHHSPAFTMSRYAHVMEGEAAPPLSLDGGAGGGDGAGRAAGRGMIKRQRGMRR